MPGPLHLRSMDSAVASIQEMVAAVKKDFARGTAGLPSDDRVFFDTLQRFIVQALMDLHAKAVQGEITLGYPFRLSITDSTPGLPEQPPYRRWRVGFLATTGDPVHWGHVLRALMDAAEFRLDAVILQVIGDHPHKPCKQAKVYRHAIARLVAELFHPIIRYCPLGYDNLGIGEQNAAEFLLLNGQAEIDLFFLAGDDAAGHAIANIDACNRLLAGARQVTKPLSITAVVSRRAAEAAFSPGTVPDWVVRREGRSEPLPDCRGMRISSRLFRAYPELPLLPCKALDYIRRHGLYQAANVQVRQPDLQPVVLLSFLPPGLHRLVARELTDIEELPALLPHGRALTTGTLGANRITLLAAAGKETSLLPIMERPEVRTVLGIGLCGSFQSWLTQGAIVLPTAAVRGDGVTGYWADPRFAPTPDFHLFRVLLEGAESLDLDAHVGCLYTTASIAREKQIATALAPLGVLGVEMELALHWTLAALHGKRAASVYVVSDNVALGDDILRTGISQTPLLRRAIKSAIAVVAQAIARMNPDQGERCRSDE